MKSLNPNDLGTLVESCQQIRISDFLKDYGVEFKKALINSRIDTLGLNVELSISTTCYEGIRFWFKCLLCGRRAGVLFLHPLNNAIGCRLCLKLKYHKSRYKGMIEEGLHKGRMLW